MPRELFEIWARARKVGARTFNCCVHTVQRFRTSPFLSGMDQKIMQEVLCVIEDLKNKLEEKERSGTRLESVDTYFDLPDLNVIWGLVAAIRYEYGVLHARNRKNLEMRNERILQGMS